MLALLVLGLIAPGTRAGAQDFGLSVTASATSVAVSNTLTYTISVTNQSGGTLLQTLVGNTLSGPAQITAAIPPAFLSSNATSVVFLIGSFLDGTSMQFTVTVQASDVGSIMNTVSVSAPLSSTNVVSTTVTTAVTNATSTVQADLGVAITGPAQAVITNDYMTYRVIVSNAGPSTATGVVVNNGLPPGVGFRNVSPANLAHTVTGSNVLITLGTLTNQAVRNLALIYQPTNAGPLTLSASVRASGITDPNSTNDSASADVFVTNYLALLAVTTNSAQQLNRQVGLMEQMILVSNTGTSDVPAVRLVVSDLTNILYNAVGTNNGEPFVVHGFPLGAGQSINLLLQFGPMRHSFPFTNSQLHGYGIPAYDLAPPADLGTLVNFSNIFQMPSGSIMIQFPSLDKRTYNVVYSDNMLFTNAFFTQPAGVASANWSQWIDYGPPETQSHPTNGTMRFYRVYLSPQ